MYCTECGKANNDNDKFCTSCGHSLISHQAEKLEEVEEPEEIYIEPGYSSRADHPTVHLMRRRVIFSSLRAGLMIGGIIFTVLFFLWLYWEKGFTLLALEASFKVGIIAPIISLPFFIKELLDTTWEGTVTKAKEKVTYNSKADDEYERNPSKVTTYVIKVKIGTLRSKKLKYRENEALHYYSKGTRVKHHKNYKYLERYDKNLRKGIRCIHCFTVNDKEQDFCRNCSVALMK